MKKLLQLLLDGLLILATLFLLSIFVMMALGESGDMIAMNKAASFYLFAFYGMAQGAVRAGQLLLKRR